MRTLNYFAIFIFIAAFSTAASAQLCGQFGVTLNVYDNEMKPVTGHSIKIIPWLKDELKGDKFEPVADKPGVSEIKLFEGHVITGNYKLQISAPGYTTQEKSINFPHCTRLSYDVVLLKKGEKRAMTEGHIADEMGRSVNYIWTTFTSYADGSTHSVSTDFLGNFELKLKPGDYKITFNSRAYLPLKTTKFNVPQTGKATFNLLLRERNEYQ